MKVALSQDGVAYDEFFELCPDCMGRVRAVIDGDDHK
jgi:hypothetical protein